FPGKKFRSLAGSGSPTRSARTSSHSAARPTARSSLPSRLGTEVRLATRQALVIPKRPGHPIRAQCTHPRLIDARQHRFVNFLCTTTAKFPFDREDASYIWWIHTANGRADL